MRRARHNVPASPLWRLFGATGLGLFLLVALALALLWTPPAWGWTP